MMRGTTPTHIFTLPFEANLISNIRIIYTQGDEQVFVKEVKDCNIDGNTVTVRLTQEETFLFDCKKYVEIQVRALTNGGDVLNSNIMKESVERCLDNEVIR